MSKISPISIPAASGPFPKPAGFRQLVQVSTSRGGGESRAPDRHREDGTRLRELEARLAVLETAIIEHATALRDRVGLRLDCLEQKFRYEADGLRRALQTETSARQSNIIQLTQSITAAVDRVESNQQAAAVQTTLHDLVSALAVTRTHLDGLSRAVSDSQRGLAP